jgi:hypothetical protein
MTDKPRKPPNLVTPFPIIGAREDMPGPPASGRENPNAGKPAGEPPPEPEKPKDGVVLTAEQYLRIRGKLDTAKELHEKFLELQDKYKAGKEKISSLVKANQEALDRAAALEALAARALDRQGVARLRVVLEKMRGYLPKAPKSFVALFGELEQALGPVLGGPKTAEGGGKTPAGAPPAKAGKQEPQKK